ncbi:hypothetical protein E6C76_02680 [Pseudothauera nasutitermitis]|uniref:EF-hand domain-containing protein n=1 Tax=Pseudothauera nasutitermitis TaxID=2565930 RepID=A0A4S4B3T7_9RHOO|nr:EF-hand domain-containing protein [Pseudothauera nasutitermitis]THF67299.1 hypothetical protein E6C76_02680 [Pseudothauera nasutitermitis]
MSISSIGSSSVYTTLAAIQAQAARTGSTTYSATASSTSATSSVSELFSTLDGDSDGSVTEQEFSDALSSLLARLNEQVGSSGQGPGGPGGVGGMPPPPPPEGEDEGFSLEELTAQLEEIGDSDPTRASLLSSVIENFDTADSDGDGKVTFKEAMALQESQSGSESTSASSTQTQETDLVLARILQLAQTYGISTIQASLSQFSVSA